MNFYVKQPEVVGKAMTIVAGGELDMFAAPALREALKGALEADVRTVVLDLKDATFIDSTAIGTLIGGSKQLRESGRRLLLSHCTNRNILRTFEIVGLEREIPVSRAPDPSEQVVVVSTGSAVLPCP